MAQPASLREELVRALWAREAEIAADLTRQTAERIPAVRSAGIDPEVIRRSIHAHNEVLLHLLAHPEEAARAEPPVGTSAVVRELARRALPLPEIIRSYQLNSARWHQICTEVLATLTDSTAMLTAEGTAVSRITSEYLDRVCARIAEEYEDERQRWLRHEETIRLDRVLSVLGGDVADVHDAEQALGYRLRQPHLAVVAWVDPGAAGRGVAGQAVQSVVDAVADHGSSFPVVRDARTVWAWIPRPARDPSVPDLTRRLAGIGSGVRLALGRPGSGLEGFLASHRQAVAAHDVGRASRVATVFPYDEVSALAFLVDRPEQTRRWLEETLGSLALPGRREEVLRTTVRAYLRCHQSSSSTARELHCHKNTVLYRLRLAEELLGRPVDSDPLHLGLALQAVEWLGPPAAT